MAGFGEDVGGAGRRGELWRGWFGFLFWFFNFFYFLFSFRLVTFLTKFTLVYVYDFCLLLRFTHCSLCMRRVCVRKNASP